MEGLPFKAEQNGEGEHAQLDFEGEGEAEQEGEGGRLPVSVMQQRATDFHNLLATRRSVRFFSSDVPPMEILEQCILAGGTAPSGTHSQPWHFAVVKDPALKAQIRADVETAAPSGGHIQPWYFADDDVHQGDVDQGDVDQGDAVGLRRTISLGTLQKPYLTEAPYLVVLFKQTSSVKEDGSRQDLYYASESTGIAAGMFIAALHNANLATLTSTPMGAESKIRQLLGRPDTEKVFLLMPVGWPAQDATVPDRPINGRKRQSSVF